MEHHLSEDVLAGLAEARSKARDRRHRLRIEVDGAVYPVLHAWNNGFSVATDECPQLRGFVDLYDGSRHVASCLVMCATEDAGTMRYDYKRLTKAQSKGAVDFELDEAAPVALLPR